MFARRPADVFDPRGRQSNDAARERPDPLPPTTARLLELQRTAGNQAIARTVASAPLLQRFAAPVATRPDVRVSQEQGMLLVGKKDLYATQERIDEANTALAAVAGGKGAFLRLEADDATPPTLEGMPALQGLKRVAPVWTTRQMGINQPEMKELDRVNKADPDVYLSHADCHLTAQTIMGSTENLSNVGGGEKAIVEGLEEDAETTVEPIDKKVTDDKRWASHGANRGLDAFLIAAMPKLADRLQEAIDDPENQGAAGGRIFKLYRDAITSIRGAAPGVDGLPKLRLAYRKVVADRLLAHIFGQLFGVNQYVVPEIGDALVQFNDEVEKRAEESQSERREAEVLRREEAGEAPNPDTLPREGRDLWNFHWAGVIMKEGNDYVTLENLSVEFASVKNELWYFAMYGPLEQSFHSEAARDPHVGQSPTTLKFRFGEG